MEVTCCIKFLLIIFNSLFSVSGLALIMVGAMSRTTYGEVEFLTGAAISHISTALVAVGIFITVAAFIGSIGAWLESRLLLGLFTGFLILILSMEIVVGLVLYVCVIRSNEEQRFTMKAKAAMNRYNAETRTAIDQFQKKFHCCGVDHYTDWFRVEGWQNRSIVPHSCCRSDSRACGMNVARGNIYQRGCLLAIKVHLEKNLVMVGAACISLVVMEVVGAFLGMVLFLDLHWRRNYQSF